MGGFCKEAFKRYSLRSGDFFLIHEDFINITKLFEDISREMEETWGFYKDFNYF
jgi:hypothetical protein